jgi:hypothetical protein
VHSITKLQGVRCAIACLVVATFACAQSTASPMPKGMVIVKSKPPKRESLGSMPLAPGSLSILMATL